jgi:hypothetical protein
MRRFVVLVAVLLGTMIGAAQPAWAVTYFSGYLSSSAPYDSSCIWYYANRGEGCSGNNYWSNNTTYVDQDLLLAGHVHQGFQNASVIRGVVESVGCPGCPYSWGVTPGQLSMGGQYLTAHLMYWDGGSNYWQYADAT